MSSPFKVQSRIDSLLDRNYCIAARDCSVVELKNSSAKQFLGKNHLNVVVKGKYNYALVYKFQLVALAVFSRPCSIRRDEEVYHSYELMRFCSKLNTNVVGGFSKLLLTFINKNKPDDVMTYLDLDWSRLRSYSQHGFENVGYFKPIEFVITEDNNRVYPTSKEGQQIKGRPHKVYNSGSAKMLLDLKKSKPF